MAKLAILLFLPLFSSNVICQDYANDDTEINSMVMKDLMNYVDSMARDSEGTNQEESNSDVEMNQEESDSDLEMNQEESNSEVETQQDSPDHMLTKRSAPEERESKTYGLDDGRRRRKPEEYAPGDVGHKKSDGGSDNRHSDNGIPVQVAQVNQHQQQISGKREDVPPAIVPTTLHNKKEQDLKTSNPHDHHLPKLCSEVMEKVLQIAEPMRDEIIKNVGEVRLGFGYFAKKVKDAALKGGIISGQNGQPCIPSFKIDMNRLFTYWAENFQGYRSARSRSARREPTNDVRTDKL